MKRANQNSTERCPAENFCGFGLNARPVSPRAFLPAAPTRVKRRGGRRKQERGLPVYRVAPSWGISNGARTVLAAIVLLAAVCVLGHADDMGDVWQSVRMRVTAYCPCPKCCGEYSDGITANGHKIRPGDTFVAADKRYAFSTKMVVPGYNNSMPVEVLDRGGAITADRLDVFFGTHEGALQWGVRYLDVKVRIQN